MNICELTVEKMVCSWYISRCMYRNTVLFGFACHEKLLNQLIETSPKHNFVELVGKNKWHKVPEGLTEVFRNICFILTNCNFFFMANCLF